MGAVPGTPRRPAGARDLLYTEGVESRGVALAVQTVDTARAPAQFHHHAMWGDAVGHGDATAYPADPEVIM